MCLVLRLFAQLRTFVWLSNSIVQFCFPRSECVNKETEKVSSSSYLEQLSAGAQVQSGQSLSNRFQSKKKLPRSSYAICGINCGKMAWLLNHVK
jgi:hypothetical protein